MGNYTDSKVLSLDPNSNNLTTGNVTVGNQTVGNQTVANISGVDQSFIN